MTIVAPHARATRAQPRVVMPRAVTVIAVAFLLVGLTAASARAFAWRRVAIAGHVRCLPVAYTPADQERGLQRVTRVARPMLFAYRTPAPAWFWMKDTPIALTGVWVGVKHRVVGYWHGRPDSTVLHASPGLVSAVLEYRAGVKVPRRGALVSIVGKCAAQPGGL